MTRQQLFQLVAFIKLIYAAVYKVVFELILQTTGTQGITAVVALSESVNRTSKVENSAVIH